MLRPWALWLPFPVVCWAAQKIGRITIDGYPAWHVSRRWIIVDKSDATAWRRRAERAEAALARAAQAGDADG